eukprot:1903387-Prymnesium_polylepis.1
MPIRITIIVRADRCTQQLPAQPNHQPRNHRNTTHGTRPASPIRYYSIPPGRHSPTHSNFEPSICA